MGSGAGVGWESGGDCGSGSGSSVGSGRAEVRQDITGGGVTAR